MPTITIVGLGPGDPDLITRRAWACLTTAPEVRLRTRSHPAVAELERHTRVRSYDELYEQNDDFVAVYQAIAADVIGRAGNSDVVYAVPGDPSIAEATTHLIRSLAAARGIEVIIEPGVSFLEPGFAALREDPIRGVSLVDASSLAGAFHPLGSTSHGLVVAQLYSRLLASDVKLTLMNAYPDEHPVILVTGAGTTHLRLAPMRLFELDRHDNFDDLTSLWVPPLPHPGSYTDLQNIIAHLRAPDGCPWDREQTHESLRPYLLEETYEVLEALDSGDSALLVEELGDLFIQIAMHIQIATEEGEFKLDDVIRHVVGKLVRRHPHVFGNVAVDGPGQVLRNWEAIKQAERAGANGGNAGAEASPKTLLDGIPRALPALTLTQSYLERLSRVGYPAGAASGGLTEAELARILLDAVARAQASAIDAESTLRRICIELRERLQAVEALALTTHKRPLAELTQSEQADLWRNQR